jgi:hypothetical protein
MSKYIKIEVKGKEYLLGFGTRASVKRAEKNGLDLFHSKGVLTDADNIIYTSMLDKQPEMTQEEADEIITDMIEEGEYDYTELTAALSEQISSFFDLKKKSKKGKKIEFVEM